LKKVAHSYHRTNRAEANVARKNRLDSDWRTIQVKRAENDTKNKHFGAKNENGEFESQKKQNNATNRH
jgi:hypothetical protein